MAPSKARPIDTTTLKIKATSATTEDSKQREREHELQQVRGDSASENSNQQAATGDRGEHSEGHGLSEDPGWRLSTCPVVLSAKGTTIVIKKISIPHHEASEIIAYKKFKETTRRHPDQATGRDQGQANRPTPGTQAQRNQASQLPSILASGPEDTHRRS